MRVEQAASQARNPEPREDNSIASLVRRWLLFGFFLVLFVDTVNPSLFRMQGLISKDLVLYALVGLAAVTMFRRRDGRWRQDGKLHVVFIVFIAYLTLRMASAFFFGTDFEGMLVDRESQFWRMVAFSKAQWIDGFLILLLYRFGVETREDVVWLLRACTLTLLSLGLVAVHASVSRPGITHPGFSPLATWGSNSLGAWLVFFLPLAVALIELLRPGPIARLGRVLVGVCAVLLILTGARGAWLAAFSSVFVTAWYLRRFVEPRSVYRIGGRAFGVLAVTLVIIGLIALIGVPIGDPGGGWVKERGLITQSLTFGTFVATWSRMLEVMSHQPLSFLIGSAGILPSDWIAQWRSTSGRLSPFDLIFRFGLIGLSILIALFGILISQARANLATLPEGLRPLQSAFILGLIGLLIAVSFGSNTWIWHFVWTYVGLMLNLGSQRVSDSTGSVPSQESGLEGKQA